MLMPKKVKYRKQQRGRMAGQAWRGSDVSFGDYGLKALEPCWMTARQIEAARVAMTRFIKRGGKIWVRVFPDKPVTKKPQGGANGGQKRNPRPSLTGGIAATPGRGTDKGGLQQRRERQGDARPPPSRDVCTADEEAGPETA